MLSQKIVDNLYDRLRWYLLLLLVSMSVIYLLVGIAMKLTDISDDDFLKLLEEAEMPSSFFDHAGHVRAAWLYVERYPLHIAIEKCCHNFENYARSLGAVDKFHRTVTVALVSLIACYQLPGSRYSNWSEFTASNEPLMQESQRFLLHYYSPERLSSSRAKRYFCAPDKKPFAPN